MIVIVVFGVLGLVRSGLEFDPAATTAPDLL